MLPSSPIARRKRRLDSPLSLTVSRIFLHVLHVCLIQVVLLPCQFAPHSNTHVPQLFLEIIGPGDSLHRLVVPTSDRAATAWTSSFLHGHPALADGEWMAILAIVPNTNRISIPLHAVDPQA